MEEDKQLDFNAPVLSVRRFASASPPVAPSASFNKTTRGAAGPRGEASGAGAAGGRSRRSYLPFYKSDLKSGPVRNPGVVPFVWEKSPGRPKEDSFPEDSPTIPDQPPVLVPKPPPGRIPWRPPGEKEDTPAMDATNPPSNSPSLRRSSPIASTVTSVRTRVTAGAAAAVSGSPTASATSSSNMLHSSREGEQKANTTPVVDLEAEERVSKEQLSVNDDEEVFSDALDTLSRTESFYMNCSVSGVTGGTEAWERSGRFLADPQVQDFMMERFLPAAQAMAVESPLYHPRKAAPSPRRVLGNGAEQRRPFSSLPPVQRARPVFTYPQGLIRHLEVDNSEDIGSDDDDDDDDVGRSPLKGCGFLPRFCLKGSFGHLNPLPGLKTRGRTPSPTALRRGSQLRTSRHFSSRNAEDQHSWEEVYRHKLMQERRVLRDDGSRLTSESNRLSYWTDSQTPNGSSPYRRSIAGGISPYRNDTPSSPFHEGRGFLGVPGSENQRVGKSRAAFRQFAKDEEKYWIISPHRNSKENSGSESPAFEKTVYVDCEQEVDNPDLLLGSSDAEDTTRCLDKDSGTREEGQRVERSPGLVVSESSALQRYVAGAVDAERQNSLDADGLSSIGQTDVVEQQRNLKGDCRQDHALDEPESLEPEHRAKNVNGSFQPLVPPPLPKSPTESWLWRTLPSVSSKNPVPQTLSRSKFDLKKQVPQAAPADPKWEEMVKTSVSKKGKGQVRFAEALINTASVD